jgi:DNA-binding transcriptional MerR regulator/methylmalonyl-CoA mutase cobalamin-binding subunit
MYTIKEAAARAGLSVPTVRVWERRYGVVHPSRTSTGYRLYDDAAIARLAAMRHLVENEGVRPSQAAEMLSSPGADVAGLAAQAGRSATSRDEGDEVDEGVEAPSPIRGAVGQVVAAARRFDVPAIDRTLDEAFAAERFEDTVEHVVFPALRAIGDGWADGSIDVAMEHATSEAVRRRLARFFDAAGSQSEVQVVVGLPPDSHHEIGALAFAVAARRAGLGVLYLGADVPMKSWLTAIDTTAASVAVVGVVGANDVAAATDVIAALDSSASRPRIAIGGPRAAQVARSGAAVLLPDSLETAVSLVRGLLVAPGASAR